MEETKIYTTKGRTQKKDGVILTNTEHEDIEINKRWNDESTRLVKKYKIKS